MIEAALTLPRVALIASDNGTASVSAFITQWLKLERTIRHLLPGVLRNYARRVEEDVPRQTAVLALLALVESGVFTETLLTLGDLVMLEYPSVTFRDGDEEGDKGSLVIVPWVSACFWYLSVYCASQAKYAKYAERRMYGMGMYGEYGEYEALTHAASVEALKTRVFTTLDKKDGVLCLEMDGTERRHSELEADVLSWCDFLREEADHEADAGSADMVDIHVGAALARAAILDRRGYVTALSNIDRAQQWGACMREQVLAWCHAVPIDADIELPALISLYHRFGGGERGLDAACEPLITFGGDEVTIIPFSTVLAAYAAALCAAAAEKATADGRLAEMWRHAAQRFEPLARRTWHVEPRVLDFQHQGWGVFDNTGGSVVEGCVGILDALNAAIAHAAADGELKACFMAAATQWRQRNVAREMSV